MAVKFHNDGTDFRLPAKGRIRAWIRRTVENEGFRLGAVNFIFCSPEKHLEINRRFLGHDYATDVITFDYSEIAVGGGAAGKGATTGRGTVSGDIFIDPATVADNAALNFTAPEVEMRRVVVHGVLHLCGYGDKTPRQQKTMRAKEDHFLTKYYSTMP